MIILKLSFHLRRDDAQLPLTHSRHDLNVHAVMPAAMLVTLLTTETYSSLVTSMSGRDRMLRYINGESFALDRVRCFACMSSEIMGANAVTANTIAKSGELKISWLTSLENENY